MPAGAITLNDIESADWSLMLDQNSPNSASGSGIGNVVQGIADVNQCIGIILTTPRGSDPLRPTFACDLWRLIDTPINVARPALINEIVTNITKWEPRVQLIRVIVNPIELSQIEIDITWRLAINGVVTEISGPPQNAFGTQNTRLRLTIPSAPSSPRDIASILNVSQITDWSQIQ